MIPEYISPPLGLVLTIAFCVMLAGLGIARWARVPLKPTFPLVLTAAAFVATGLSLVYSYTFRGGDYFWRRHGYPHYFWGVGALDGFPQMTLGNLWGGFDLGPLGLYVWGSAFFYASVFLCAYVILRAWQTRTPPAQ